MLPKSILIAVLGFGTCAAVLAQKPDSLQALTARAGRLEAQLRSLESVRAIERVQYAYGHYVELGLWNDFADLFVDDAKTNYQQGANSKEAIRKLFFDQVGQGRLGLADGRIYPHILFEPVVTLSPDGHSAKGRWRILAMLGGYGGSATWYSGVYENQYRLENGAWKISLIHSEPKVTAAYTAAGWKDSGVHVPFDFNAADLTTPFADTAGPSGAASVGAAPSLASLADRVNDLARRAERLNDQDEVTNLQDRYGYAIDRKLWDQAANLFATDGTWEQGLRGVYLGKASIRRGLNQFGPQGLRDGERNDHVYLETIVSVAPDGLTSNARGVEIILSSAAAGRDRELTEGIFENTFIKQDCIWKIQSVHFYPRMIVDAAAGWAKSAKPAPGASKEYPPDRPPTASYEIYPKFSVAPFHFNNPVTGKPPQYPAAVAVATKPLEGAPSASAAPAAPAIHTAGDLAARISEAERSIASAEAYDAAQKLIDAYGYYLDESPAAVAALFTGGAAKEANRRLPAEGTTFVNQVLQPVIEIARDGKSANVRARLLDLNGTSGGAGYWTAGAFEGKVVLTPQGWKFQTARSSPTWSARYP